HDALPISATVIAVTRWVCRVLMDGSNDAILLVMVSISLCNLSASDCFCANSCLSEARSICSIVGVPPGLASWFWHPAIRMMPATVTVYRKDVIFIFYLMLFLDWI